MERSVQADEVVISIESNGDVDSRKLQQNDPEEQGIAFTSRIEHRITAEEIGLSFRTLQPTDRQVIQELHEEWFPVSYEDEFYDELVKNRMFNSGAPLFSCVAIHHPKPQLTSRLTTSDGVIFHFENYNPKDILCREINPVSSTTSNSSTVDSSDKIVACVVGSFLDASRVCKHTRDVLLDRGRATDNTSKLFYIMTLGTVAEFRHLGLATMLVEKCIDLVEKDPSCGALYLHVITFNHAAIRFYEKIGFYRVEEVEDYYTINEKRYNCYLYAKYFHGNRGQRGIFNFVSTIVSTVWDGVLAPVSLLQELVVG